jgi:hypothetical protein
VWPVSRCCWLARMRAATAGSRCLHAPPQRTAPRLAFRIMPPPSSRGQIRRRCDEGRLHSLPMRGTGHAIQLAHPAHLLPTLGLCLLARSSSASTTTPQLAGHSTALPLERQRRPHPYARRLHLRGLSRWSRSTPWSCTVCWHLAGARGSARPRGKGKETN